MVIEPLLMVLALSTIFAIIGQNQAIGGPKQAPFPIFFYCGILPWSIFAKALNHGTQTFLHESSLLGKYSFPREILIAKNAIIYLIEFLLASLAFGVIMLIYRFPPTTAWAWLPLVIALLLALCMGIMLMAASVNVYIRDVSSFLTAMSSILFWLSPVIYRIQPEGPTKILLYLNPIAGIIESIRCIVLDGIPPPPEYLLWPAVWTSLIFFYGYRVFRKLEKGFVDAL